MSLESILDAASEVAIAIRKPWTKPTSFAAANTNRDGTGQITEIVAAGPRGGNLYGITFKATGTTAAGRITIYAMDSQDGAWRIIGESSVSAVTPSATATSWSTRWTMGQGVEYLLLGPNAKIGVATTIAQEFVAIAEGGDF